MRVLDEDPDDYAGSMAREGLIEAGWHDVPRLRPPGPPPSEPERPGLTAHWRHAPGGELYCIWTAMQRHRAPPDLSKGSPPSEDDGPGPAPKDAPSLQTLVWLVAVVAFVLLLNATGARLAAVESYQPAAVWE